MRRLLLGVTLAVVVSISGCAGFGGEPAGPSSGDDGTIEASDPAANATNAAQTVRIGANESVAGNEWESLSVTYPREDFTVDGVQHRDLELGVDTDDDGAIDRRFNETHVSGVNNNHYSLTVELDVAFVVTYPAVDNPAEAGEYAVEVTLNDAQNATGTLRSNRKGRLETAASGSAATSRDPESELRHAENALPKLSSVVAH